MRLPIRKGFIKYLGTCEAVGAKILFTFMENFYHRFCASEKNIEIFKKGKKQLRNGIMKRKMNIKRAHLG